MSHLLSNIVDVGCYIWPFFQLHQKTLKWLHHHRGIAPVFSLSQRFIFLLSLGRSWKEGSVLWKNVKADDVLKGSPPQAQNLPQTFWLPTSFPSPLQKKNNILQDPSIINYCWTGHKRDVTWCTISIGMMCSAVFCRLFVCFLKMQVQHLPSNTFYCILCGWV